MEYNKIVSVTGLPGLYELINSKSDGALVRSLDDKNTKFVSSRIHNFSHLESIEVYTNGENVNLVKVFEAMENSEESIPSESDSAGVKKYFEKVYGDIDFTRVYNSDMKKMVRWFTILKANQVEIKLPEPEPEQPEPEPVPAEPVKSEVKKEKPKKKAAKEKAQEEPKKEKATKKTAKSADTKAPAKAKKKEEKPTAKKTAKKSAGKSAKKK